jgi:hypothetical protein
MAFKNEYVPPLEQESSGFLKKARETLRTGYSKYDAWTVDRGGCPEFCVNGVWVKGC